MAKCTVPLDAPRDEDRIRGRLRDSEYRFQGLYSELSLRGIAEGKQYWYDGLFIEPPRA